MKNKSIRKLLIIIIILLFILLPILYGVIENSFGINTWKLLLKNLIPDILCSLIIFVIVYFIFVYKGMNLSELIDSHKPIWLNNGYENFKAVNWSKALISSQESTLVAFYFENWLIKHDESFRTFLKNNKSKLTVYLPNYENKQLMNDLVKLIPKYDQHSLTTKIKDTIREIKKRLIQENVPFNRVSIRLYDNIFNYTLQRFDTRLFFSINELCRETDYKSPFIEIDIKHSSELKRFFDQELETLDEKSHTIDLQNFQ